MPGETVSQRRLGSVETVRQDERRIEQLTAYLVERADRHEFKIIENA